MTVVTNIDNSRVIAVMDGRTEESLSSYLGSLDQAQRTAIAVAAMDMWPAYINAVKQHLPNAKIAFDRFHIAKHLGDAVNAVRKDEHRELLSQGDATLAKTKFVWLQKPNRMKRGRRMLLKQLIYSTLRTARLDFERDGVKVVALHQRNVGASRMEGVDRLGEELQT